MKATLVVCPILLLLAATSHAASLEVPVPAAPAIGATSYLLSDYHSGRVIAEKNVEDQLEPASITKLMTAYIAFSEIASGNLALDEPVTVSEKAWRTPGSRMFIEVDRQVSVQELLMGMIVQSGNDASVALAEHIAGSEDAFASLMNQYAAQLGLTGSSFRNSTGLPDPQHFSTARDISRLAVALIRDHPQFYEWYSIKEYTYADITQHNRNSLLWRDESVDGIKTGHTDAAGYCLVSSARRGDMRLVAVVLGTASEKARAEASHALLNYGFRFYETHRLYGAGEAIVTGRVFKGALEEAPLGLKDDLYVTIPRGRYDALDAAMDLKARMIAPLDTDESLGRVRVHLGEQLLASAALYALEPVPAGSLWRRAVDEVRLWFE